MEDAISDLSGISGAKGSPGNLAEQGQHRARWRWRSSAPDMASSCWLPRNRQASTGARNAPCCSGESANAQSTALAATVAWLTQLTWWIRHNPLAAKIGLRITLSGV